MFKNIPKFPGRCSIFTEVIANKQIFKILMWPCKKYQTHVHNFWCKNYGYFNEKNPIFVKIDRFLHDLQPKQILRQTDRQTNFKLSNNNTFNNGTTGTGKSYTGELYNLPSF